MSSPGSEAGSGASDSDRGQGSRPTGNHHRARRNNERDDRQGPGSYRPPSDRGQPGNGYGPPGNAYRQDGGPRYPPDGNGYGPGGNGYRQASDYRGAGGRDDWRWPGGSQLPPGGNHASGDYRPPGFDDRTTRGYRRPAPDNDYGATAEFPAPDDRRPPGDVGRSAPGAGWSAGAGRVGQG
ncbi:MAG TPA: hypothetical protein VFW16_13760, partial [Streptosporangiaceae bacterium]|nr:hypothetical protein [Streptosporangiaceae bacterium]